MAYKRKYKPGEVITSIDEMTRQEFVYCNDKIFSAGWVLSWQLRMAMMYIQQGRIRYAIKIKDGEEKEP